MKDDYYAGATAPPSRQFWPQSRKDEGRLFMAKVGAAHALAGPQIARERRRGELSPERYAVLAHPVSEIIADGLNHGLGKNELRHGLPSQRYEIWRDYLGLIWRVPEPGGEWLEWTLKPWVLEAIDNDKENNK